MTLANDTNDNGNTKNRVNIINFIRGVEPRLPIDLLGTLQEEIRLVNEHRLPATWLIQYDALIDPAFVGLLREQLGEEQELGAWFEVVQPMVERAGLEWRGRYPWDWHAHIGFSIGYTPVERERLADVFMAEFHLQFGYYPRSVGSWFLDAHLLGYLSDRYGIVASCNCKDQWGTDGYTLWGGYYNQAYYPSRSNGFMPAQTQEGQIPVPVFRMLGSDPIYQYDAADYGYGQTVITLEPVYTGNEGGGGKPEWVRWFFDTNFLAPQLSFGYTQVGQENSFGWERIAAGLTDQIAHLARQQQEGLVRVETLADSGAWFKQAYPVTPASSILALQDWRESGKQSLWFYNRYFRANLLRENGRFIIRDIHLFDERYAERYLTDVCKAEDCYYDTLPVMDGGRWGSGQVRSGIMPVIHDEVGGWREVEVSKLSQVVAADECLSFVLELVGGEKLAFELADRAIAIRLQAGDQAKDWGLRWVWGEVGAVVRPAAARMEYEHEGFGYQVSFLGGAVQSTEAPGSGAEPGSSLIVQAQGDRMAIQL